MEISQVGKRLAEQHGWSESGENPALTGVFDQVTTQSMLEQLRQLPDQAVNAFVMKGTLQQREYQQTLYVIQDNSDHSRPRTLIFCFGDVSTT